VKKHGKKLAKKHMSLDDETQRIFHVFDAGLGGGLNPSDNITFEIEAGDTPGEIVTVHTTEQVTGKKIISAFQGTNMPHGGMG
jgi:hypothetical protein